MQTGTVVDLDELFGLKVRINSFFASIPDQCCKVCYILGERTTSACGAVCKKFSGVFLCPQYLCFDFLILHTGKCIRCFQKHAYKDCKSGRFTLPGKTLCYKCFLPFVKGVGPDLHPGPIGALCTSPACEALPQAAVILFYSNSSFIPSTLYGNLERFLTWLVTVEHGTGLHGIVFLLSKLIA